MPEGARCIAGQFPGSRWGSSGEFAKIVLISGVSRSSVGPIAHNLPHFHPHDADGFPDLGIRCLGCHWGLNASRHHDR
jgi:hypothetical protein